VKNKNGRGAAYIWQKNRKNKRTWAKQCKNIFIHEKTNENTEYDSYDSFLPIVAVRDKGLERYNMAKRYHRSHIFFVTCHNRKNNQKEKDEKASFLCDDMGVLSGL
jgi:hypothetical protein